MSRLSHPIWAKGRVVLTTADLCHDPSCDNLGTFAICATACNRCHKDDLAMGNTAGLAHYRRAGEMLLEAKEQVTFGRWGPWLNTNFKLSRDTAQRYMRLARLDTNTARRAASSGATLSAALGDTRTDRRPSWQEPIRKILEQHVDVEAVAQERQARADEQQLRRELAIQLVDIGYKALATRLHPDRGGSKEATVRKNHVSPVRS